MENAQPGGSTSLVQHVNSLHPSRENSPSDAMTPTEPSATDPPTPKRKAPTNTSKPKPKRVKMAGRLSGLLSLPLDIFFEITSHLHPLDLLRLSRASRHFARMFLCTENRHAWLAARRTVEGLPECPSDLSEAQYAHLLFESLCSGCGKIGRRLLYNLRVRFCAPCYKANVETLIDGVDDNWDLMLEIVPHNYNVTDPSIIEYFQDQFEAIMGTFMDKQLIGFGTAFFMERQEAVSALLEHGSQVSDFLDGLQERKDQERTRLRVARKQQIDARIMALGYTRDDIPEDYKVYRQEIMKPRPLTERAWRNMADKMDELAAAQRQDVLEENMRCRLQEWVNFWSLHYSHGDWPDACNTGDTETVLELLSEANASIPFTADRFDAHSDQILMEICAWRDNAKSEIVEVLVEVYGMAREAASLYRASSVICCTECFQLLFASDVMSHLHVCNSQWVLWGERKWGYEATFNQMARTLLHHAGLAFDTTSARVDELELTLTCDCGDPDMGTPTGFLELITHLQQEGWSCDETFKLYRPDDGRRARAPILLELNFPYPSTPRATRPLRNDDPCCRLCSKACFMLVDMRSPAQAKQHMEANHRKEEVLEEDLCRAKDVFRAAQEYVDAHGGRIIVTRRGRY